MTKVWHTWVAGYRACVIGIARDRNWFESVRPNTKDSIQWFDGWDAAEKDLKKHTK